MWGAAPFDATGLEGNPGRREFSKDPRVRRPAWAAGTAFHGKARAVLYFSKGFYLWKTRVLSGGNRVFHLSPSSKYVFHFYPFTVNGLFFANQKNFDIL
jgi:hypothetical protein